MTMKPREGMELAITTQKKTLLLSLASWSWRLGMGVLRSKESLTQTEMKVSVVALSEKYLQGNQYYGGGRRGEDRRTWRLRR